MDIFSRGKEPRMRKKNISEMFHSHVFPTSQLKSRRADLPIIRYCVSNPSECFLESICFKKILEKYFANFFEFINYKSDVPPEGSISYFTHSHLGGMSRRGEKG